MSESAPDIRVGNTVRIMHTDKALAEGLAGTVFIVNYLDNGRASGYTTERVHVTWPVSGLMKQRRLPRKLNRRRSRRANL